MDLIQSTFTPSNVRFLMQGLKLTLVMSISVVLGAILFGTILGLLRNYEKIFFGKVAALYIEIFRNTPLLLWMLACAFLIPFSTLTVKGAFALFLYSSAIMAEIVRGGLNSIPKGQWEAASSQGFDFFQTLVYIILPQTFQKIIPSLLSQVITTIKDTSFLAGLGITELTRSGQVILGRARTSTEVFIIYTFLAVVYFTICFSLSVLVRAWEKKNRVEA